MIPFQYRWCSRDGTPIVRDYAIEDYTEQLLEDYRPELLKEPGRIDAMHFLEHYLGLRIDFADIYAPEGQRVAGATVFCDDYIPVFDREHYCIRPIHVKAGTVLLDNRTMAVENEAFAQFTMLHEAGHFCMHQAVYKKKYSKQPDTPTSNPSSEIDISYAARCTSSMLKDTPCRLETDLDFREHQANTFAAALAMPRPVFIPLTIDLIHRHGQKGNVWFETTSWASETEIAGADLMGLDLILDQLSWTFGVSKSAARVQMKRQGLLKSLNLSYQSDGRPHIATWKDGFPLS